MNGWKYDWVDELPRAVYDLLLSDVLKGKD